MKNPNKPLVIVISLITTPFIAAEEPAISNPNPSTIKYQGGNISVPIIEASGHNGIHNLVMEGTQIHIIDKTSLATMSFPAIVSIGGDNGSLAGNSVEKQKYGNLSTTLDKDTQILVNLTSAQKVTGIYSRTDSATGVSDITSNATIDITSHGAVIGISSQNFSSASGNGIGGEARLALGENSNIHVSGAGQPSNTGDLLGAIAAQVQGDNATLINNQGSQITVTGQTNSHILKGLDSWAYKGTSIVDNKGTIQIDASATTTASIRAIEATSETNNSIQHASSINIQGGENDNLGIKSYAHYGTTIINTTADSLINIEAPNSQRSVGILAETGNQTQGVLGELETYINASGNIAVNSNHYASGIESNTYANSNIIYNNAQGYIHSSTVGMADASTHIAYAINNVSTLGEAKTIIHSADNISASSPNGSATAISSLVTGGSADSSVYLTNTNNIAAMGNKNIVAISAQNNGSGNTEITLANTVKQITSSVTSDTGKNAAVYARSQQGNTTITSAAQQISTTGNNNHGILSESLAGDSQVMTSSQIKVSGKNSAAISSITKAGTNKVTLASGANLVGGNGINSEASAIIMNTQTGDQHLTIAAGASIASLNDSAIYSTNTSGQSTITNSGHITGYATITGKNVTFTNLAGTLNMKNFSSGSKDTVTYTIGDTGTGTFNNQGTIQFSKETLDDTPNQAVFNVANFYNNTGGVIDLTSKNPNGKNDLVGDKFTINGNYIANGGSIYLNTKLDDATTNGGIGTSDLLLVTGNVTTSSNGATKLYIMPTANSFGALTQGNGIKVVDVKGLSSTDAFMLGRPLTAGAYEYVLNKGTMDNNWYLSSFYVPTGGNGSGTGQILYNPAIGTYLANQTAAVEMFQQTLFDRLISVSDLNHDASKRFLWLRTNMIHGSRRSVQANFSHRSHSYTMQLGGDIAVWQLQHGYFHMGLMAGYGDAKNTSTSRLTRTTADGKVKGYSTGIYGTWFQHQDTDLGLYIDTWSQMGWYRNEVSGEAQIGTKKYNSSVWSNSIEAGYGLLLGKTKRQRWIATPQIQLTYNLFDTDNLKDNNNLYVSHNKASGLTTRTGIRLHERGTQKQWIEPFIEVNWLHSTAKNQLTFNGNQLKDGLPQNRFETKVGLQSPLNDRWTISAQVSGQWGQNHFNQYEGQCNINYRW